MLKSRWQILVLALLLAAAETAGGAEPVTVGVLDFAVTGEVGADVAGIMEAMLVQEIEGLGRVRVIGEDELRALLAERKQESLVDFEWKCPAEGFREMLRDREPAVRWVVAGQVTRFGKLYVLSLKLFDLKSRTVAGRVIRRTRGEPQELREELSDATQMLFEEAADRVGVEIIVKTVTSAARHRQLIEESPSAVTVLTREDIEASGADSIPNLLRLVPGMDVIVSSGAFQSVSSRLNWTNEGNTYLVLIDGREINYDPLGFPPWEIQPVFLEDIERIEVIRGPASSLYGANAFAGVVSITTREIPERTSAGVVTSVGEAGRTVAGLRASSKLGDWGIAVGGGADISAEFVDPRKRDKRVWKIRGVVERKLAESRRLLIDLGLSFGEGSFSSTLGTVRSRLAPISVRLAYESEDLRGQLYWIYGPIRAWIDTPIEYAGTHLADFVPAPIDSNVVDGQLQWTPPRFWEPLLLIVGGGARVSWMASDVMLDARSFDNPASPRYHQEGIDYREFRSGAFFHAEYALAEWVSVTGGARIDYDTQTEWFVSPRLAAVFQPAANHYLRAAVARSFRKPSFIETVVHLMAEFPQDSPIQGTAQDGFLEFLTRVGGNSNLDNEELLSFEAGYLGRLLDGRLSVSLDLYYNRYRDQVVIYPDIQEGEHGLPDLERSNFIFTNGGHDLDVIGSELSIRYSPSGSLSFLASWTHRQIYDYSAGRFSGNSPKNLITLGGRFRTAGGLLGSLYAFARSEFSDVTIENPAGILQPLLTRHMDNVLLLMGKLGRRFELGQNVRVEMGIKLFLPVSPFAAPHFRYYEAGGGIPPTGNRYGAEQLGRMVTGYIKGSF